MPATAFLYIAVIVLALAVIALAVWSAMLSNRIKKLSDRMLYSASAQPAQRTASHAAVQSSVQSPAQSPASTVAFTPQAPVQPIAQAVEASAPAQAAQPTGGVQPIQSSGVISPYVTGGHSPVRSVQPAVARVRTNAVQPMEQPDDGESFFESYRDRSEGQQPTGAFRRERPTIPFGEDRNEAARLEVYAEDAISGDFDPDSIDFSRVAGYRNLRQP